MRESGTRTQVSEWVIGIIGGIAAFLGLFILFGGDDQSIGIGGAVSWEVGEISVWWAVGLLATGVVAGGIVYALRARERQLGVPTEAHSGRADLFAHATAFVLVNAFIWAQDILIGDGLNYALWITVPWAVGLAAHATVVYAHEHGDPIAH